MGNSHLSTFIYITVLPGVLTGVTLVFIGEYFELTKLQLALIAVPLCVLVLVGWMGGMALIGMTFASAFRMFRPFPCCNTCHKPLATRLSQQCFHCGADWHSLG